MNLQNIYSQSKSIFILLLLSIIPSTHIKKVHAMEYMRQFLGTYKKSWFKAARDGDLETIKNLASKVDINAINEQQYSEDQQFTALHIAASQAHVELVEFLVTLPGIDINARSFGYTALHLACQGHGQYASSKIANYEKIVSILVKAGIDINAKSDYGSALALAAHYGHERIVNILLQVPTIRLYLSEACSNLNPIQLAAQYGRFSIFQKLAEAGSNLNVQDNNGDTILHRMILLAPLSKEEHMHHQHHRQHRALGDAEQFLYKLMNNLNDTDIENETEKIAKFMLEHDQFKINAKNKAGKTALSLAKERDHQNFVSLIENKLYELQAHALLTILTNDNHGLQSIINKIGVMEPIDAENNTLLHKACKANMPETVRLILHNAEDPRQLIELKNKNGQTALELVNPTSAIVDLFMDMAFATDSNSKILKTEKKCAQCTTPQCKEFCGRCKKVYYCSVGCQKKHWKTHKKSCC